MDTAPQFIRVVQSRGRLGSLTLPGGCKVYSAPKGSPSKWKHPNTEVNDLEEESADLHV